MKYARRRDANEPCIVAALEGAGARVAKLPGDGLPDLIVDYGGVLRFLEVKNPETSFSVRGGQRRKGRGTLTSAQVKWFANWRAQGGVIHEVVNVDEALRAIGARQ